MKPDSLVNRIYFNQVKNEFSTVSLYNVKFNVKGKKKKKNERVSLVVFKQEEWGWKIIVIKDNRSINMKNK